MEELFNSYSHKTLRGNDESRMFSEFFETDRKCVEEWVNNCMQKLQVKNDDKANELKCEGTVFYAKKDFGGCLRLYTKALCRAVHESESYSVILANRSAVFYMMQDYKNCLKDINLCLSCAKTPENIRLKVHLRKIKCHAKAKSQECDLIDAVTEAMEFLGNSKQIPDKAKVEEDILGSSLERPAENRLQTEAVQEIPDLKDGPSNKFLYASSAVRISYNELGGRHVVANKQLEAGDVLFVEKAFSFAPIFINESMELPFGKCYHCLSTALSCLPCKHCIQCVFCDENCRDSCWSQLHQWECVGMRAGLWYHLGIAFPAFRALIKGVQSGFLTLTSSYEVDTELYGNACDNYPYFNKLVTNIPKMANLLPVIISATVVVVYLRRETDFFDWLMQQPGFLGKTLDDVVVLIGGRMTRHIAQLQCNSSTLSHRNGESSVPVACAIYPSVSIMNHSCKPNITMHYVRDVVIVEAAETIAANEEVCNCYGIDYRFDDWKSRQEQCRSLYYFKCECRACKLPT